MTSSTKRRTTRRASGVSKGINRRSAGISIVEFAAACAFGLPLVVIMIYAVLEANYFFAIKTNLDLAQRRASQLMIDQYLTSKTYTAKATNSDLPTGLGFDIPSSDGHYFIKNGAQQFTWQWDFSTRPYTLTVSVVYPKKTSNTAGFLPFPNPDPLGLGSSFQIVTQGTFAVPG